MRTPQTKNNSWHRRLFARATPVLFAYFATLLAIPVNAGITLPSDPLTTSSRVPPNILFILDDSGSMQWKYMYNPDVSSISGGGISSIPTGDNRTADNDYGSDSVDLAAFYDLNYVTNTLYYNPNVSYNAWLDSTGTPLVGGLSYTAAYSDNVNVQSTFANTTSATVNLSSVVRTFYFPKGDISNYSDATQYYRYQILTGGQVVRSERMQGVSRSDSGTLASGLSGAAGVFSAIYSINLPAGASNLSIQTASSANCRNARCADLYVRLNATPTLAQSDCAQNSNGNSEACNFSSPAAGVYNVRVYGGSAYSAVTLSYSYDILNGNGVSNAGCDTSTSGWGWRNCTYSTPVIVDSQGNSRSRTDAEERTNFAAWYSYYRTRTKAAKAAAGTAFSELGTDVRVGYRTIWGRNGANTNANIPTQTVPIPVAYNQGLFDDPNGVSGTNNNRAEWYRRLYSTIASNGTPLRSALTNAGEYFSQTNASGPYGPEAGSNQLQCRQNFTILTTDGYWNSDSGFNSGGNQDGSDGSAILRPDNSSYTYTASRPYSDGLSNTLADVAMRYWKNDLRADMPNIVPTTGADPAFWQHMVTFGLSIGLRGDLDPASDLPAITAGTKAWPSPVADNITTIDDLWHASVNGRGRFVAASNPGQVTSGLRAALSSVTERTGSFSNVSANSTSLTTGTRVYQATYVSGVWTGEVTSYPVTAADGVSTTASWRASEQIPTVNRKVFTSDGVRGLAFPASATVAQIASLARVGGSNYPVSGEDNAAYIAGTRRLEIQNGGTLRNRSRILGDIVSSSPAYVPETNSLYVGSNDGMLHAINAANGAELFAYLPNGVSWSGLNSLSRPDYTHRYSVDGPVVVSTRTQTPGKNTLVGTLGKGGKGLFALDVTNPTTFGVGNFKWEVTEQGGDMGLIQSKPVIAKLNTGETALIVSNGVNSTNGRAVLLIYNLDTGALIRKIDTGVGSPVTDSADSNGLSTSVGWDSDGNGTVDAVYAGDLLGNLWKFDVSSSTATTWGVANSARPIFAATYTGGATPVRQPITGGLTVALNPTTFKTWVFFGTGRLMTTGDLTNMDVQSMYGFVDDGTVIVRSGASANLTRRTTVVAGTLGGRPVRSFEANSPLPATSKGWYVDLVAPPQPGTAEGERIVSDAQLLGDVLVTSSVIPTASACQADGRGYLNALDAFTGTSSNSSFFDLDGDGSFTDEKLTSGGRDIPVGSVDLGVGMPTLANLLRGRAVLGGSSGNNASVGIPENRNVGRVSWREVKRGD